MAQERTKTKDKYEVKLPVFEGPMDLLLHLIKKNEIDIYDIPIALITEQYLAHLEMMRSLNLDIAGEFLVTASTLAYIKSRMLLPRLPIEEDEPEDPREALVRQLLEYQRYKKAAAGLERLAEERRRHFPRIIPEEENEKEKKGPPAFELAGIGVYTLWRAFRQAMENAPKTTPYQIMQRKVTLEDEMAFILAELEEHRRTTLQGLFAKFSLRLELVLLFSALLELTRRHNLKIYQNHYCGPIWITTPR